MIHPPELRQVSVANLTVGRLEPVRFIEEAAAAGFGAVGLLLASATPQPLEHEIAGRPDVMRAVKAALRETGLRVFDVEAFVLSPDASIEAYRPYLEAGAELGATHISSVGTQWLGNSRFLEPSQRIDLFARLCDEAARFGLHVGVEFMLYRDIRTWRDALDLVEAAGRPNAGLILDMLHLHRAGTVPAELAAVPANRIAYAQLCDVAGPSPALDDLPMEARTARLHLGDGDIPLRGFLDLWPETTPLVIETPVPAEAGWPTAERLLSAAGRARTFLNGHKATPSLETPA
jgi:sugar phosphate isomerase/epimerase